MDSHHLLVTFASAASLGVFLLILAARLKISAIVLLLIGGILAGPEFLGIVNPDDLGAGLNTIISLAVGIILFEGGLTLDVAHFKKISREVGGILTKGVLVTWFASAVFIKLIFDFSIGFCIFAASLIIVTGPTVIGPLLARIRVKKNLHHILHWEGVMIDPIGVFIALLCFEWIVSTGSEAGLLPVFGAFLGRFAVGVALGLAFGQALFITLKREWVPEGLLNIFVLACAILNFTLADLVIPESGLLSVTVAGLWLGYKPTPKLDKIIAYKVELKDLLIGLLFVLLAANLKLARFTEQWQGLVMMVAAVMFVVRPLNVFIGTFTSQLQLREKLFLSWIAPRGIVAASMASVFALRLADKGMPNVNFLETFTYAVIAGTVLFQGFTAKWVGRLLGVMEPRPTGWLVIGAHRLGRRAAEFIQAQGDAVVLVDTNPRHVREAKRQGFEALCDNAMVLDPEHEPLFYGVGNVMAITENQDLNSLLCRRWDSLLDKPNLYRWARAGEDDGDKEDVHSGVPIWTNLQLKELLARDLTGDLEISIGEVDMNKFERRDEILMSRLNGQTVAAFPPEAKETIQILRLGRFEEGSGLPIQSQWVVFSRDEELGHLYTRMLRRIKKHAPDLDEEAIHAELVARDEEFTSLLGHGISLPHSYSPALSDTILMAARLDPGIPCQHTGEDIRLLFMVLSPEDRPVEHLNLLSNIAKFIMKDETRQAMMEATDEDGLYDVLERGGA